MSSISQISVTIPTVLALKRSDSIERARASALAQRGVHVHVMVVVNGQGVDARQLAGWRGDRRVNDEADVEDTLLARKRQQPNAALR